MAIILATFDSYAVHEILGTQAEAIGNNQIVLTDDIQAITGNNGNVVGTDYVGRIIVLNLAGEGSSGAEQTRKVTADAAGTGNLRILTVSEDWDTNPSTGTSDTVHVFYNKSDSATIVAALNARTGFHEMSEPIIVGNGTDVAGLWLGDGALIEIEDSKSTTAFHLEIQNAGRLQCGYLQDGKPVAGNIITGVNNSDGEAWTNFEAGGEGRIYDTRMIASVNRLKFQCDNTSDVQMDGFTIFQGTEEGHFFDAELKNGSIVGTATATEIIRVDAGSYFENVVLQNLDTLTTASGDTTTETLSNRGCVWIGLTDYLDLIDNKTWNIDNPAWGVTLYSDINDSAVTGAAAVNERRTVDAVIQKADGTKLQDALVIIYENTLADLVQELVTDASGVVAGAFNYLEHLWTAGSGATTTRSGHSLRIDKWLYFPFVADQVTTDVVEGSYSIGLDANISQQTQATAITDGSGIVWNEDTNPSELFDFTLGSGTYLDGMILTFSSGAVGTITELASGDSVAGEIHLKDRNSTAITNGDTFSRTGGTVGTFSGTYTNDSKQPFSIWLEANAKSYQVQHDYWAARSSETTLNAIGEIVHEWGRGQQERVLNKLGSDFFTERSNSKGVYIVNAGTGSVSYYTDDAGNTWAPPATVTLQVTVTNQLGTGVEGIKVRYEESDGTLIANGTTNGSGIFSYGIAAGLLPYNSAKVIVRDKRFEDPPDTILNITTAGFALVVGLQPDTDINLP